MEINEYVRTKDGIIKRVSSYNPQENNPLWETLNGNVQMKGTITKHSKDIIDLIEDEDQIKFRINGDKCYGTVETELCFSKPLKGIWLNKEFIELKDLQIISILTHEQFESNAYTIEKER